MYQCYLYYFLLTHLLVNAMENFENQLEQLLFDCDSTSSQRNWIEVSSLIGSREYFLLYFRQGNRDENDYLATAKVGYWDWKKSAFPVEYLTDNPIALKAINQDLGYYLEELPKQRRQCADNDFSVIWQYQQYHCSTATTIYSDVLWRYRYTD